MEFWRRESGRPEETPAGDWMVRRAAYFCDDRPPDEMKFAVEKLSRVLLELDAGTTDRLVFAGVSTASGTRQRVTLRFEAVVPQQAGRFERAANPAEFRNQYLLQVEASAPRKWVKEENLRRDLDRRFDEWAAQLQGSYGHSGWDEALRPVYSDRVRACLAALDEAARVVEDPAPIARIQRAVLDALRGGRRLSRAHKEGGTIFSWRAGRLHREDYGEEPGAAVFQSEEDGLRAIRQFYDWESGRDTYPHRPPELEVWQYIQRQLR